jgi:ATP-dependent DNA ligase
MKAASHPPAPMLASAMTTRVTGVEFDWAYGDGDAWAMEEKLDGHRCTVVVRDRQVAAYSRPRSRSNPVANARTLAAPIVEQLARFPDGVYDGELVATGGKAWNVVETGARLVFVVFDVVGAGDYRQRRARLLDILQQCLTPDQTAVTTVESVVPSWAAIEAIWQRGGEGVIVKRLDSLYRPGHRSPEWLKVKQAHAATLTITGFEAGKSGPYSALTLRDAHGIDTTVKVLGHRMLADITAAPAAFVGRRVVIAYQEKTPSGTYRHGIFDHFAGVGE